MSEILSEIVDSEWNDSHQKNILANFKGCQSYKTIFVFKKSTLVDGEHITSIYIDLIVMEVKLCQRI